MMKTSVASGLVLMAVLLGGCSQHETNTAERSLSPLIGTWQRSGPVPKPDPNAPQFTKLAFAPDGKLAATYVAAGGALAGIIAKAPKIGHEGDSYTTDGATLHVTEGSSTRDYQYRVDGGTLYLTPEGGSDAAEFSKASDTAG